MSIAPAFSGCEGSAHNNFPHHTKTHHKQGRLRKRLVSQVDGFQRRSWFSSQIGGEKRPIERLCWTPWGPDGP